VQGGEEKNYFNSATLAAAAGAAIDVAAESAAERPAARSQQPQDWQTPTAATAAGVPMICNALSAVTTYQHWMWSQATIRPPVPGLTPPLDQKELAQIPHIMADGTVPLAAAHIGTRGTKVAVCLVNGALTLDPTGRGEQCWHSRLWLPRLFLLRGSSRLRICCGHHGHRSCWLQCPK